MLGEELLEDGLGALDAGGVVLTFYGEADLGFFEGLLGVGEGDGVEALVVDLADGGLFADVDDELDAGGGVDALNADVFKVAGVPEGVEVALDDGGIEEIALAGEETGEDGLLGDAAVADDLTGWQRVWALPFWRSCAGAVAGACGGFRGGLGPAAGDGGGEGDEGRKGVGRRDRYDAA